VQAVVDPRDFNYLSVRVEDSIAFATRTRPEQRNCYSPDEALEYPRFLRAVAASPAVRVAVVTGAGHEWFCAGEDSPERGSDATFSASVGTGRDPNVARYDPTSLSPAAVQSALAGDSSVLAALRINKPVITALNGSVTGAALTSVLMTDIVIAEEHVRLRDMHVTAGIVSASGPMLWPLSAGLLQAKRWLLTGDWIDAREAERIGLVTEVVDRATSLARAVEYARHLAALDPDAVALTKRALNNWLLAHVDDVFTPAFAAEIALVAQHREAR
jgi:enoyl-CoA hydratase